MPFISVIMACHNSESYVAKAIDSVLSQTFDDFELIFVDDCSTDRSLEIVTRLSTQDPRIVVLSTGVRCGAACARNIAITNAKGEWLSILDADDVYLPCKLERQISLVRNKDSGLVLVGSGCFHIDSEGLRTKVYKYPTSSSSLKNNLIRGKKFPPHSSLLYRTSSVRSLGGFNSRFERSEDYELCIRLSNTGDFECIEEPLIEYRIHGENISGSKTDSGHTPLEYSIAARVCKILRQKGLVDPSASIDSSIWEKFLSHLAKKIAESGEHEFRKKKKYIKKKIDSRNRSYIDISILPLMFSPSFLFHLLKENIVGNGLEKKCFSSWVKTI